MIFFARLGLIVFKLTYFKGWLFPESAELLVSLARFESLVIAMIALRFFTILHVKAVASILSSCNAVRKVRSSDR